MSSFGNLWNINLNDMDTQSASTGLRISWPKHTFTIHFTDVFQIDTQSEFKFRSEGHLQKQDIEVVFFTAWGITGTAVAIQYDIQYLIEAAFYR